LLSLPPNSISCVIEIVPHAPALHVCPGEQLTHAFPNVPQTLLVSPVSHCPAEQHPTGQDVSSQVHALPRQRWPVGQEPLPHVPPQPSLPPQAAPLQLGTQAHTPLVPQVDPLPQLAHVAPPLPQDVSVVPSSQVDPLQQPPHEVASHAQTPDTQRCPCAQLPLSHTPEQPSLAPHALLAQSGLQGLVPQTLAVPPPPHSWPTGQPPQSMSVWHESRSCPHFPAHSTPSWATQLPSVAPTAAESAAGVPASVESAWQV
jgi:hypothetical protein